MKPIGARERERPEQPAVGGTGRGAGARASRPRAPTSAMYGAEADHELEGEVDDRDVGPVLARELVQSLHLGVGVVEGEQREPAGNLDGVPGLAARPCRASRRSRAARRRPVSKCASIAASLAGWYCGDRAGAQVAGDRLQHRRGRADQQRDGQRAAVERVVAGRAAAGTRGCRRPRSRSRRTRPASCAASAGTPRVQHAGDRIDVGDRAVHQRRSPAACSSRRWRSPRRCPTRAPLTATSDAGPEMRARRDPVPAVEVDAEEDRLGEEGESLERERHADDRRRRTP